MNIFYFKRVKYEKDNKSKRRYEAKQLDLFTQVEIKIENSTNLLEDMRVNLFALD